MYKIFRLVYPWLMLRFFSFDQGYHATTTAWTGQRQRWAQLGYGVGWIIDNHLWFVYN